MLPLSTGIFYQNVILTFELTILNEIEVICMYLNTKFCFLNYFRCLLNNENSTTKPVLLLHHPTNAEVLFWVPPTFGTSRKWPGLTFVLIKGYWQVKTKE